MVNSKQNESLAKVAHASLRLIQQRNGSKSQLGEDHPTPPDASRKALYKEPVAIRHTMEQHGTPHCYDMYEGRQRA
jgi:hypothetical protein